MHYTIYVISLSLFLEVDGSATFSFNLLVKVFLSFGSVIIIFMLVAILFTFVKSQKTGEAIL